MTNDKWHLQKKSLFFCIFKTFCIFAQNTSIWKQYLTPPQQINNNQKVVILFATKIFCEKFNISKEDLKAKGGSATLKANRLRFIQILASPPCNLRLNQIAWLMCRDEYTIVNSLRLQSERYKFSVVERGIITNIQQKITDQLKSYMILKPLENVLQKTKKKWPRT